MKTILPNSHCLCVGVVVLALSGSTTSVSTAPGAPNSNTFRGRIAWSADGNFNDPDDWIASPLALAIFAEAGLRDHVVHFDYNSILPHNDTEWAQTHSESVRSMGQRYGYPELIFYDCQQNLDSAVTSISQAVNYSSADNPLYFVLAGPMEVPYLGIKEAIPTRRQFVYCISHSRWNDGYSSFPNDNYFKYTKRDVIDLGVSWVQLEDQNRLLSKSPYGRLGIPEEFRPYFWMRDASDLKLRFLWERMSLSTRPDPSDAGMAYFLVTGDQQSDPDKLKGLLADKVVPGLRVRERIRLEAENFAELDRYGIDNRHHRGASHGLCAMPVNGTTDGRLRTKFNEPYTADSARYDVQIRYFDEPNHSCEMTLSVNGMSQGRPWKLSGNGKGWTTHTVHDVSIASGDVISLQVQAYPVPVDFVELRRVPDDTRSFPMVSHASTAEPIPTHPRFIATGPLDDPAALPGQVIVAGERPGYLKHNGGKPIYLCGPDNPEDFFYLGDLNDDGTRSGGPQTEIIKYLGETGVNTFHILLTRMRCCNIKDEGDDTHCPFIDHDPSKALNEKVLDQWEQWLTALETQGVIVDLEFYNDATDVERIGWSLDDEGNLHPGEKRWIERIVKRFKHHRNIMWSVEESCNKLPRRRTAQFKKIGELIAKTDDRHHPIVQSFVTQTDPEGDAHPDQVTSDEYVGDPNIRVVTWLHLLPHPEDMEAQHREYLRYARMDTPRFIAMKNETHYQDMDSGARRLQTWACVMTGMHTLEAQHNAARPRLRNCLPDDGRVVAFMERTDWYLMTSRDDLAAGSTKWVLARPGYSYIAYSYDCTSPMGIWSPTSATYDLLWFDTVTGAEVRQMNVHAPPGEATWPKPAELGNEIALYVQRLTPQD